MQNWLAYRRERHATPKKKDFFHYVDRRHLRPHLRNSTQLELSFRIKTVRTISILWTVWNSYRIPTVLDGEPARARSQPHNMHIELRSEPEPDDPNQAGCITKKDRPSSKSMCGFKECSHATRKNIKIEVTGQRSLKPWAGGGLSLAKPYSAKPYSAVQESAKPYSSKPYSAVQESAKLYSDKPYSFSV